MSDAYDASKPPGWHRPSNRRTHDPSHPPPSPTLSDEAKGASGHGRAYWAGLELGRDDGRKEERERMVALIHEHIVRWQSGEYFGHELAEYDDFDEVIALKRLLSDVEETSHE